VGSPVTAYIILRITREFRLGRRSRFAAPGAKQRDKYWQDWREGEGNRRRKDVEKRWLGGGRAWMAKSERNAENKKEEFSGNMDNHATWELLPQICVVSETEYVGNRSFLQGYGRPQYSSNMKRLIKDLEKDALGPLFPHRHCSRSHFSGKSRIPAKPLDRA